jgi:plasmid stability protein
MLLRMRTTINLDDEVFRAYKQRAAVRGMTFAQVVEDALRADLQSRVAADEEEPFDVLVFDEGSSALIDINDNRALQEMLDGEEYPSGDRR